MARVDLVLAKSIVSIGPTQPLISKVSLADKLAQSLIRDISGGTLRRGEQLPTETELCTIHGVSRITVRRALELLQRSGLIDRIAGKGTFVAGRSKIANWQLDSIEDLIQFASATRTAAPKILCWKIVKPIPEAKRFLNLNSEKAYLMLAVRYIRRKPVYLVEGYIPRPIGDLIKLDDLKRSSPIELFDTALDMPSQRVIEEISACRAPKLCADPLGIREGDPVILHTLMFHGPDRPLQYLRTWWHHKHFKRRNELTRR